MMTLHFYRDLDALESFALALATDRHVPVPRDWWIVVADVVGSTRAIEAGAYKSVNTVGVACIAAVMNVDRYVSIPFVFGGDGATFAVPAELRESVVPAFREAQRLARHSFGLELRVGMVPVADLVEGGLAVNFAKIRVSPHVMQATFSGRGWAEAERRIKDEHADGVLSVQEKDGPCNGSFEGFECRWQDVPSFRDHKLALLVAAISADDDTNVALYRELADTITTIYGDIASYHPLKVEQMHLSFDRRGLSHEHRVRTAGRGFLARQGYLAKMLLQNCAGSWLFSRKKDTKAVQWSRYVGDMIENSDVRKFDGILKMIMDGTEAQCDALTRYLDAQHRAGRLAYGIHKSREALVTCIVSSYNGNHVHFVDGGDGGYAMAARGLKAQLKGVPRM